MSDKKGGNIILGDENEMSDSDQIGAEILFEGAANPVDVSLLEEIILTETREVPRPPSVELDEAERRSILAGENTRSRISLPSDDYDDSESVNTLPIPIANAPAKAARFPKIQLPDEDVGVEVKNDNRMKAPVIQSLSTTPITPDEIIAVLSHATTYYATTNGRWLNQLQELTDHLIHLNLTSRNNQPDRELTLVTKYANEILKMAFQIYNKSSRSRTAGTLLELGQKIYKQHGLTRDRKQQVIPSTMNCFPPDISNPEDKSELAVKRYIIFRTLAIANKYFEHKKSGTGPLFNRDKYKAVMKIIDELNEIQKLLSQPEDTWLSEAGRNTRNMALRQFLDGIKALFENASVVTLANGQLVAFDPNSKFAQNRYGAMLQDVRKLLDGFTYVAPVYGLPEEETYTL